jgi:hypothetical protein
MPVAETREPFFSDRKLATRVLNPGICRAAATFRERSASGMRLRAALVPQLPLVGVLTGGTASLQGFVDQVGDLLVAVTCTSAG